MVEKDKITMPWFEAYEKLAKLLVAFYKKHGNDSSKELYKSWTDSNEIKDIYNEGKANAAVINTSGHGQAMLLQPVRHDEEMNVFQLYSDLGNLTDSNRLKVLNILFSKILQGSDLEIDEIDYRGYVKCNYLWSSKEHKESWALLKELSEINNDTFKELKNKDIINGKTIGVDELTIFYYLFNYRYFLPQTKQINCYLISTLKISTKITSWYNYYKLLETESTDLYKILVVESDVRNRKSISKEERVIIDKYIYPERFIEKKIVSKEKIQQKDVIPECYGFRFIGLKILDVKNKNRIKYEKVLELNKFYGLYDCYELDGDNFKYDKTRDVRMYDNKDLKINVSAIVGKNGSGKSTIFELLYMALYNISFKEKLIHDYVTDNDKKKLLPIGDLNIEIFIETDRLYKISVLGENHPIDITVTPYKHNLDDGSHVPQKQIEWDKTVLEKLCYNLTINYSIHGLNEKSLGPWLHNLFHKNDSYQVPIVIEPYRANGNIDVNKQEHLAKYRLLANVLKIPKKVKDKKAAKVQVEDDDFGNRELVENKMAEVILLECDFDKLRSISIFNGEIILTDINQYNEICSEILSYLELDNEIKKINNTDIKDAIKRYLFKKIFKIIYKYQQYRNRYLINDVNNVVGIMDLRLCINDIQGDSSHISYKFNQAVNFIKYYDSFKGFYERTDKEPFSIYVENYGDAIDEISIENSNIPLIELLPPPIFNLDIKLRVKNTKDLDSLSFDSLSSGEKQLIYAVNSIAYHVSNINSVHKNNSNLLKYRNVNILLDEIELYFHPEMQRKYLSYLLDFLSKMDLHYIGGVNICFVTHSPFILSDIPECNILFLDKKEDKEKTNIVAVKDKPKTFGANIHELLIHGFFMKSSIGEFVLQKIKEIVDFSVLVEGKAKVDPPLVKEYEEKQDYYDSIVRSIGDTFFKGMIENHIRSIEKKLFSTDEVIKNRISRLDAEKSRLNKILE